MAESPGQDNADSGSAGTMPTPDQNPPQPSQAEGAVQEAEVSPEEELEGDELELPKGVSERTKQQFDKLKDQLREYRERLYGEQTFKSMTPPPTQTGEEQPLYDPKTGLVDVQALNNLQTKAKEADERAQRAETAVQSYIENVQTREAYQAYPELNPKNDKFDESLHRTTRAFLMDSMVYPENYGGGQLTYKEAADLARQQMGKTSQETTKEETEQIAQKEQASLGAEGRPSQGVQRETSSEEYESLRYRTRKGDEDAMAQRMKNIPTTPSSRPPQT